MNSDLPADFDRRFAELGEVPADEVAAATEELAGTPAHDLVYYGIKAEKAFAELADRVSETAHSRTVREAGALLAEMLETLRGFSPEAAVSVGWWRRLLGGGGPDAWGAYRAVAAKLDRLAGRLEGCSNPLLTEALTLERYEQAVHEALAAMDARLKAGLLHLPALKGTEGFRDLLLRLEDMFTARAVAQQNLATIALLGDNRMRLAERVEFLLDRALPLWRRQAELAMALHDQLARGKTPEEAERAVRESSPLEPGDAAVVCERVERAPGSLAGVFEEINARLAEALHADEAVP